MLERIIVSDYAHDLAAFIDVIHGVHSQVLSWCHLFQESFKGNGCISLQDEMLATLSKKSSDTDSIAPSVRSVYADEIRAV